MHVQSARPSPLSSICRAATSTLNTPHRLTFIQQTVASGQPIHCTSRIVNPPLIIQDQVGDAAFAGRAEHQFSHRTVRQVAVVRPAIPRGHLENTECFGEVGQSFECERGDLFPGVRVGDDAVHLVIKSLLDEVLDFRCREAASGNITCVEGVLDLVQQLSVGSHALLLGEPRNAVVVA